MRAARNTALSAIVSVSRVAAVAVTMMLVARTLGATRFGVFAYALTLANMLAVIPDYGFSLQLVARTAEAPGNMARPLLAATQRAKVMLALMAVVCAIGWGVLRRPDAESAAAVAILFASAIAQSFGQANTYAFRGCDRFDLDAIASVVLNSLLTIGVVVGLIVGRSPVAVACAYFVARVGYLLLTTVMVRKLPPRSAESRHVPTWPVLREGFSYGVHSAVAVVFVSMDTIVLEHFRGSAAVGLFQAGMRLVFASALFPEILTSGLFPNFARSLAGDASEARRLAARMNRYLLVLGALVVSTMLLVPRTVTVVLYGHGFGELPRLLPWFGLIILFRFVAATYGAIISASGHQVGRTVSGILAAVLNIVANVFLIPRYGVNGALAASVMTHAVLLMAYAGLSYRVVADVLLDRRCVTALGLTAVLIAFGVALRASASGLVGFGVLAVIVFVAVATGLRSDEWRAIRSVVPTGAARQ